MGKITKVLAMTTSGTLTYCCASEENRGKGRCNHIAHQKEGESVAVFIERTSKMPEFQLNEEIENLDENSINNRNITFNDDEKIQQIDIDEYAKRLDKICGCHVDMDNYDDVLSKLTPEQIFEVNKLGYEASPNFSLPITDEEYIDKDLDNKLYFSTLPKYGISGKQTSIQQMFESVGETQTSDSLIDIDKNYKEGLTPDQYFEKIFSARLAQLEKSKGAAQPGYAIWENQKLTIWRQVK